GVPVVAGRLRGLRERFEEDELLFFEPDDEEDLARVLRDAMRFPERARAVRERGIEALILRSGEEKRRYLSLAENLGRV
ncbi:MAG: glycosyltransferase, partial [Candidatus Eisenbacteria bacterium]